MKFHHHFLMLLCAAFVIAASYNPDRPAPPPRPMPPAPVDFTGTWQGNGVITYTVRHEGQAVTLTNDSWPAVAQWTGTVLVVAWRGPRGHLLYAGEYRLMGGDLVGHYWPAENGWRVPERLRRVMLDAEP